MDSYFMGLLKCLGGIKSHANQNSVITQEEIVKAYGRHINDTLAHQTREFEAILEKYSTFTVENLQALEAECGIPTEEEYFKYHTIRFLELFRFLLWNHSKGGCRTILEVGTSPHTTPIYRKLFPDSYLATVCRPHGLNEGPPPEALIGYGSQRHTELDLNTISDDCVKDIDLGGKFDTIICCETVEHLTVPPRCVLTLIERNLSPGGIAFVTTPNFLTKHYVAELFANLRNPSPTFITYKNNFHSHHHFREYTAVELVEEARAAKLQVDILAFSNCWDPTQHNSDEDLIWRSNLVLVANAARHGERSEGG
jgi:SAM-dependent methyltransferase